MSLRRRLLLLGAVSGGAMVVLLGAVAGVSPALAAPSQESLEVNYECHNLTDWPCWTHPGEKTYVKTITIAQGGVVKFSDEGAAAHGIEANIVWTSTPAGPPSCTSGVPIGPTMPAKNGWSGECKFEQLGTYDFESSTMFYDTYEDYRHYEIVVAGPPTPTATTEQATGVAETKATLNGSVNPEGQATTYYFNYGTTPGYGSKTNEEPAGSGSTSEEVHAALTGLSPNTTYYFQLVAVYGAGKTRVQGGNMTFKTAAPPGPPTASTDQATGVTETEATLKGAVNPDGEATKYFFKWGTTTGYGQTTSSQLAGGDHASHSVSSEVLTGLAPGTTYHYQIVAENKSGTVPGTDETFTTKSAPVKEPPANEPTPTPTPTPTPGPISPEPEIAPMGPALVEGSLKLTAPRHGSSVHGSVEVSRSGAGGRLEIDLIVGSASLAKVRHRKPPPTAMVGRLVRASVSAGKVSFLVSLTARGKSALRRHRRLALTVKVTLTPTQGAAVTVTRGVVLRD